MLLGETILLEGDFTGSQNVCANVQCFFLHKKQDSLDKCHCNKLLGDGKTYVAARQEESTLGDIASIDFQDKSFLT